MLWTWSALAGLAACAGCQTGATLHAWTPPEVTSAVGKTVAVAPLAGPRAIADEIESQLFRAMPRDQGRAIEGIPVAKLRPPETVRLTSGADPHPSDLALLPIARQRGVDFLLMGEVLEQRSSGRGRPEEAASRRNGGASELPKAKSPEASSEAIVKQERVSVAWRIYDVAEARPLADRIIVADPGASSATHRNQGLDESGVSSAHASGRQVWRLLSPTVQRHRIQLAVPWLLPGSNAVRRGNEFARNGRWPEAERLWRQTLERHPYQHAARHNLAMAAAARQNFSAAKQLIREAVRQRSKSLYQENLAWIEVRQRDYHRAFGFADPPEGWFLTTSSPQTP